MNNVFSARWWWWGCRWCRRPSKVVGSKEIQDEEEHLEEHSRRGGWSTIVWDEVERSIQVEEEEEEEQDEVLFFLILNM